MRLIYGRRIRNGGFQLYRLPRLDTERESFSSDLIRLDLGKLGIVLIRAAIVGSSYEFSPFATLTCIPSSASQTKSGFPHDNETAHVQRILWGFPVSSTFPIRCSTSGHSRRLEFGL